MPSNTNKYMTAKIFLLFHKLHRILWAWGKPYGFPLGDGFPLGGGFLLQVISVSHDCRLDLVSKSI